MADSVVTSASADPQKTINAVVDSVKSEGLFDQFRKECLESFENMETYHQLKQRVENHVASFLSKHKFHDGLQKNLLRNNLRTHVTKSDVLLNSIQQLVDEVLSLKGHSICLRIDKQVDKYLNKDAQSDTNQQGNSLIQNTGSSQNVQTNNELNQANNELNSIVEDVNSKGITDQSIMTTEVTEIEEVEMEITDNVTPDNQEHTEGGNEQISSATVDNVKIHSELSEEIISSQRPEANILVQSKLADRTNTEEMLSSTSTDIDGDSPIDKTDESDISNSKVAKGSPSKNAVQLSSSISTDAKDGSDNNSNQIIENRSKSFEKIQLSNFISDDLKDVISKKDKLGGEGKQGKAVESTVNSSDKIKLSSFISVNAKEICAKNNDNKDSVTSSSTSNKRETDEGIRITKASSNTDANADTKGTINVIAKDFDSVKKVEGKLKTAVCVVMEEDCPGKESEYIEKSTDESINDGETDIKKFDDISSEFEYDEEEEVDQTKENESETNKKSKDNNNKINNTTVGAGNVTPLITEPISDDSTSNHSSFTEERDTRNEEALARRKSKRVRTLPIKFREREDQQKSEDTDSISSNDFDVRDVSDETSIVTRISKRKNNETVPLSETHSSKRETKRKRSDSPVTSEPESANIRTRRSSKKIESQNKQDTTKSSVKKIQAASTPPVHSPEESHSPKRTRSRSVKQRKCYSPS